MVSACYLNGLIVPHNPRPVVDAYLPKLPVPNWPTHVAHVVSMNVDVGSPRLSAHKFPIIDSVLVKAGQDNTIFRLSVNIPGPDVERRGYASNGWLRPNVNPPCLCRGDFFILVSPSEYHICIGCAIVVIKD